MLYLVLACSKSCGLHPRACLLGAPLGAFTLLRQSHYLHCYNKSISVLCFTLTPFRITRSFGRFSGHNDPMADQPDKISDCSLKESNKYQVVVITVTGT
jgi:hypothetical protein